MEEKKKIIAVRRRKMCRKLDKMNAFAGTNVLNLRHKNKEGEREREAQQKRKKEQK